MEMIVAISGSITLAIDTNRRRQPKSRTFAGRMRRIRPRVRLMNMAVCFSLRRRYSRLVLNGNHLMIGSIVWL